ncbi:hypothetical protein ACJDU8_12615 [Clostridium sp. WILCCON 0269]|uniref:Glycosyltransferase RgtA/B/C/D-like domain-containing protein n=1 Tax=Candidatus Clostridium eludens TaxID=3381663 RepID=A0ABW8SJZ7_9CLOT
MKWLTRKIIYIKNNYIIEVIVLVVIAVILANTLFLYPIVGKCDNGDFGRLLLYGGLINLSNSYHKIYDKFVHLNYLISSPGIFLLFGKNWVSGSVLLKLAVFISLFLHGFKNRLFDIRYLAFVYSIIFLLAIFLIINFNKLSYLLKVAAGIIIILFFTDISYISYFNSFYGEAGTIVFFFLSIGTYLNLITKEKPSTKHFIYFFIASAGFLTSKAQEIPLFIFMFIVYIGLFICYKEKTYRKCIIISSLLVFILCSAAYISLTDRMNQNNMYQAVFLGILTDSQNPEKDLQELGLNKKFVVFNGKSFYNRHSKNDPLGEEMLREFYPNISPVKILGFYLKHPLRLWKRIVDSANNAYDFSELGRWNFIKGQYSSHKLANTFRTNLINEYPGLHRNIYIFILFSISYFCIIIICFMRNKDKILRLFMLLLLFILLSGASQLILPVIGSGYGDFGKHLFLLNLCYDVMVVVAILWCLHIISKFIILKKDTSKNY